MLHFISSLTPLTITLLCLLGLIILLYNITLYTAKFYLLKHLNRYKWLSVRCSSLGAVLYLLRHASVEMYEYDEPKHRDDGASDESTSNSQKLLAHAHQEGAQQQIPTPKSSEIPISDSSDLPQKTRSDLLTSTSNPPTQEQKQHRHLSLRMKMGKMRLIFFRRGRWLSLYLDDLEVEQWVRSSKKNKKKKSSGGDSADDEERKANKRVNELFRFPSYIEKWIAPYVHVVCRKFSYRIHNEVKSSIAVTGDYVHLRLQTGGHATKLPVKLRAKDTELSIHREYHSKKELLPVVKIDSLETNGILETKGGIHTSLGVDVNVINFFWSPSISSALKHFSEKQPKNPARSPSMNASSPRSGDGFRDYTNLSSAGKFSSHQDQTIPDSPTFDVPPPMKNQAQSLKEALERFDFRYLFKCKVAQCNAQVEAYDKYSPLYTHFESLKIESDSSNLAEDISLSLHLNRFDCEVGKEITPQPLLQVRSLTVETKASLDDMNCISANIKPHIRKLHARASPERIEWIQNVVEYMKHKRIVKDNHRNLVSRSSSPLHKGPHQYTSSARSGTRSSPPISLDIKSTTVVEQFISRFCNNDEKELASVNTNGWTTSFSLQKSPSKGDPNVLHTSSEVQLLLGKLLISLKPSDERPKFEPHPKLDEIDTKALCHVGEHLLVLSSCKYTITSTPETKKMNIDADHLLVGLTPNSTDDLIEAVSCYSPLWQKPEKNREHVIIIKKQKKQPSRAYRVNIQLSSLHVFGIASNYALHLRFKSPRCLVYRGDFTILAESNTTTMRVLLQCSKEVKQFELINLHKVAYVKEKENGMKISSSKLHVHWSIPAFIHCKDFVKSIINLVKGIKRSTASPKSPSHKKHTAAPKPADSQKKKKKPISLKIHHIHVTATFTPDAQISASIHSVSTKSIMHEPILLKDIKFFVCKTRLAKVQSVELLLNKHPLVQSDRSSSFLELHRQATEGRAARKEPVLHNFYITINVTKPTVRIPHHFPLGNVVNEIKNAKKVLFPRKHRPEGSNLGRVLPPLPRVYTNIFDLDLEMEDSLLEQALIIHKNLWSNESQERERRETHLQKQIREGVIPEDKIEEVKERLESLNSRDYQNRISEFIKSNNKSALLKVRVKRATCDSFRNPRLKTYDDVVKMMQDIDNPPFPRDANGVIKDFGLLTAVTVNGSARQVDVTCRGYPFSLFQSETVTFFMTIMPVFIHGTPGVNTILKKVDVGLGEIQHVPGSLTGGLRIFFEGNAEVHTASVVNGPMYNPAMMDLLRFIKKLIPRSGTNPSPRLRWWDKVRLLVHGKLKVQMRNLNVKIATGVDPYDENADSLEINIKNVSANYKSREIYAIVTGLDVTYNPCLVDFSLARIPELHLKFVFQFENNLNNPNNYFFPTKTPEGLKSVDDVPRFKDKFDLYKDWRMTGYSAQLSVEAFRGAIGGTSYGDSTIMFNPIACSWIIEFIRFMTNKPAFQVAPTKKRVGVERSSGPSMSLGDFKKAFDVDIKVHGLSIVWSNSYDQNNILHITTPELRYVRREYRKTTPDITKEKHEREKIPFKLREHSVEATDFLVKVHAYDANNPAEKENISRKQIFLDNHMLSLSKLIYKMRDPADVFPPGLEDMESYDTYMMAYDLHLIWTSALRDSLFQWIDMVQQFIFTSKNVMGNRAGKLARELPDYEEEVDTLSSPVTPIGERGMDLVNDILNKKFEYNPHTPSNETIDRFLAIGLIRPKYGLLGDENSEILMFHSPNGLLLFQNIAELPVVDESSFGGWPDDVSTSGKRRKKHRSSYQSTQSDDASLSSLQDAPPSPKQRMELFVVLHETTVYWIDSMHGRLSDSWELLSENRQDIPFPLAIDTCNIVIRYVEAKSGQTPRKNLTIDFPSLYLHFSSSQIRAFIDIITNVLVPKKKGPKLVLEDQKQTFLLMGKLAPDQWENIRQLKQKCKEIRTEIRNSIFKCHQLQRSYKAGQLEVLPTIQALEARVENKKARFHALKEALQRSASRALAQEKDSACYPDFKIDLEFFNVKLNLKDAEDKIFLVATLMDFHGRIVKNTDYSAHHTFSVHEIHAENRLPNPIYVNLIESVSKHGMQTESDQCLEVTVNKSPPVGGMQGFDHFQISLAPIAFRFTYDVYKKFWAYLFPHVKTGEDDSKSSSNRKKKMVGKVGGIDNEELHEAISDAFLKGYVDTMKTRAAQRKIFKYIRFDEAELFVSFRSTNEDRTPALMNFVSSFDETRVHIRPLTYNSETWSWTELVERLKRDIALEALQHVLPQTMKSLGINKVRHIQDWIKTSLKIPTSGRHSGESAEQPVPISGQRLTHQYKLNHELVTKQKKLLKQTGEMRHHDSLKSILLLGNSGMALAGKQLLGNEYKQNTQNLSSTQINDVEREDQALDESLFDELIGENPEEEGSK